MVRYDFKTFGLRQIIKKILTDKYLSIILWVSVVVYIAALLFFADTQSIVLSPKQSNLQVSFYNDQADKGGSEITKTILDKDRIGLEYILKEGFPFPYAGLDIALQNNNTFNGSSFDYVELECASFGIDNTMMFFSAKDPNVKDTLHRLALRRYGHEITLCPNTKCTIRLKIKDFETPSWWYRHLGQKVSEFKNQDLEKIRSISFHPGSNTKLHKKYGLFIYSIKMYQDNTWPIVWSTIILLCLLPCLAIAALRLLSLQSTNTTPTAVMETLLQQQTPEDIASYPFIPYINEHFNNAELSLTEVAKETGISQRTISDAISENFHCNFKTYINQIRIREAQKLLREENLNMSEIAYKVGFNSPANFNRVFKSLLGCSPTEFIQKAEM